VESADRTAHSSITPSSASPGKQIARPQPEHFAENFYLTCSDWRVTFAIVVPQLSGRHHRLHANSFGSVRHLCLICLAAGAAALTDSRANSETPTSKPSSALSVSGLPDYRAFYRERLAVQVTCGPLSLIEALRGMGVRLTQDQQRELLGAAGHTGTSLQELADLASRYGVYALPVEIAPSDLRRVGLFAIAHVDQERFIAVTGYT
jgi:hypothetical protein